MPSLSFRATSTLAESQAFRDRLLCLSIAALKRAGLLANEGASQHSCSWAWPNGRVAKATMSVVTVDQRYGPRLHLVMRPGGQEQTISLDSTTPQFGGVRWWFLCECGDRCSKLYLPVGEDHFRCRHSLGLTYQSQRMAKVWRLQHRAHRLRSRLGKLGDSAFLRKPKGMWHRTYSNLLGRAREVEGQASEALTQWYRRHPGTRQD